MNKEFTQPEDTLHWETGGGLVTLCVCVCVQVYVTDLIKKQFVLWWFYCCCAAIQERAEKAQEQ